MRIELHPGLADDPARASCVVRAVSSAGEVVASCAVWSSGVPSIDGARSGCIGRFACEADSGGVAVLDAACGFLASAGCRVAVGPLDGSTWRRYRLATWTSGEPPFFMEPANPVEWPAMWRGAGFAPLAMYHSSVNESLGAADPMLEAAAAMGRSAGLSVRPLGPGGFAQELRAIHELSTAAFAGNFLAAPISWDDFAGLYAPMERLIDPRLVLVCDDPGRPGVLAGCILAVPDRMELGRTGACGTVVLKSLAVHPAWRSVRLGTWLIAGAQAAAREMGMTRSIFALMHDENHSARIASRYGRVMRRYALFARGLSA